jgi:hypothetical protein
MFDAAHQTAKLRDLLRLAPNVESKKNNEYDKDDWNNRLDTMSQGSDRVMERPRKKQRQDKEDDQRLPPKLSLAFLELF